MEAIYTQVRKGRGSIFINNGGAYYLASDFKAMLKSLKESTTIVFISGERKTIKELREEKRAKA